jgi:hypothetical protein
MTTTTNGHLNATDHQTASTSPRCVLLPKTVTSTRWVTAVAAAGTAGQQGLKTWRGMGPGEGRQGQGSRGKHISPLVFFFSLFFFDYTNVHLQITICSHRCTQQPWGQREVHGPKRRSASASFGPLCYHITLTHYRRRAGAQDASASWAPGKFLFPFFLTLILVPDSRNDDEKQRALIMWKLNKMRKRGRITTGRRRWWYRRRQVGVCRLLA